MRNNCVSTLAHIVCVCVCVCVRARASNISYLHNQKSTSVFLGHENGQVASLLQSTHKLAWVFLLEWLSVLARSFEDQIKGAHANLLSIDHRYLSSIKKNKVGFGQSLIHRSPVPFGPCPSSTRPEILYIATRPRRGCPGSRPLPPLPRKSGAWSKQRVVATLCEV